MWYGGLPMTERWFCAGEPCPSAGTSENYSWTYAGERGQPQYIRTVLGQYDTQDAGVIEPFTPLNADGKISYLNPRRPSLVAVNNIQAAWQSEPAQRIAKGDIVWTSKEGAEHTMVVAGWGPLLVNWEEIDAFWEANKNPDGSYNYAVLTTTYPEPNHNFGYTPHPEYGYVPYLVDHGLHGAYEQGPEGPNDTPVLICPECVRPRPYYVLYWTREVVGINRSYIMGRLDPFDNAPKFIHIPDEIAVPVEEIKASPPGFNRDVVPFP